MQQPLWILIGEIGAEIKLVVHVHRSDGETIWTDGLDIVAGILEHHVLVN
jgi:hypothetical protein